MTAIGLALGTSVLYGVANLLAPLLARRHTLGAVLLVGQGAALVAAAVAVAVSGEGLPGGRGVALAVLAGVGNAVGLAAFLRATELGPVSIAAPIGATGAVIPVLYGLATGERLDTLEVPGLVLAVGGVVLAARAPGRDEEPGADPRASVLFAIAGAVGFGVLLTALPPAAEEGRWWALLDARLAIVVLVAALVLSRGMPARLPVRAAPAVALPGLLLLAGTVLYAIAGERGPISVVAVCASINPAITVGLAVVLLGERLSRTQAAGIVAAIVGVLLIAA